jgi:hypothetical protein
MSSSDGLSQKTFVDRDQLDAQLARCDAVLRNLDDYIAKRIELAEQVRAKSLSGLRNILTAYKCVNFCRLD